MRTIITFQNYVRAQSLQEAWELNQKKRNRVVGGMMWMKMGSQQYATLVDLSDLGLDTIEETKDEFCIGAMVSLRQLEQHTGLNAYTCGSVANAVRDIVGVQFRNMATLGGSLWRRMGFSDIVCVFLSMDCFVQLYKGGLVPLRDFLQMKYDNDIIVSLHVRKQPGRFAYQVVRKQSTDLPSLNVAVSALEGQPVRVIVGGRPGKALIVSDEEKLLANGITEESARLFAEYAARVVPVEGNMWGSSHYRTQLVGVLVRRALEQLEEVRS